MGTGGRAVAVPQILLMVLQSLGGQSFGSGGKGTDPISDTPYGRERAASLHGGSRTQGRDCGGSDRSAGPRAVSWAQHQALHPKPGAGTEPGTGSAGKGWQRQRGWHSCVAFRDT